MYLMNPRNVISYNISRSNYHNTLSITLPTEKQKNTIVFLSQLLSNLLQPVWLFRFDPLNKYIFIIAGREESLEIIIFENGQWEFSENE